MKIVLIGYGKMGKAIEAIAQKNAKFEIVGIFDKEDILTNKNLQKADVAIEFTTPDTAVANMYACIDAGVPVVVGTTGWYDHLEAVTEYVLGKNGSIIHATNFSIGVNLFFAINTIFAEMMQQQTQYNVRISETHHTKKLDAPSGTAITLAERILSRLYSKTNWIKGESDNKNDLEIISKRIDDVPGIHEVIYTSDADEMTFTHTAKSRKGFAEGALYAAQWIKGKHGIFTMKDALEI